MEDNIKPYPKYKEIDLSWLIQLPVDWNVKRCAILFHEKKILNKDYLSKKAFQFKFGEIVDKKQAGTEDELRETYQKYTIVEKNDIVVNGLNLNYDFLTQRVGKVRESGIITSAYISICPHEREIYPQYASYLLKTIDNKKMLNGMGTGIRLTLSFPELKKQYLPIPPLSEQTQIANFLDYKVALINKFIKDKKREIILLKEQKQAEINQAVTRGVNPNAKMKNSGIDWIGELPEHWEEFRLKTRLQLTNNKINAQNQNSYLGMENIESWSGKYIVTDSISEGQSNIFKTGNLLFGKLRPYLAKVYLAEFDGVCSTELLVYEIVKDNPKFMQYLLLSKGFIDTVNASTYGSKMPRANSNFIGNVRLPIPTIDEQQEIINYIKIVEERINTAVSAIEKEIALIQDYKTSLISDVVTGKVDVRNVVVEKMEDIPEEEMEETEELENSEE